ncbi:heme ABC exporter ATP-binding protein CcmA [Litorimonas sp. RW-G-Af-16]|uniref:heme ABC exporter ATP-binding protein CcmA n=1 Tax=Litorimonas sp. RW-G-Af-16 TaxID=3241168 RepID=UPI00390C94F0
MADFHTYFQAQFSGTQLRLTDVAVYFGDRPIVEGLSFVVGNGDLLWVAGENGVGKTTLLRLAAGLLRPDQGEVAWRHAMQTARAESCIDFQSHQGHAKTGLTLAEDFAFWGKIVTGQTVPTQALIDVGLSGALTTQTQHLSAGQQRRLALARLLINQRPIWIMDEPMAGLDAAGRTLVTNIVAAHMARGGIALIASHNPANIPAPKVQRITLNSQETAS